MNGSKIISFTNVLNNHSIDNLSIFLKENWVFEFVMFVGKEFHKEGPWKRTVNFLCWFGNYASVNSSSGHPPARADPRELAFFENELANAPPPGQKSCSNAPG